jgi:flagellar motor switch protein FliG
MTLPPSLRKAAVLVSVLDERSAEAILEAMRPDEAAKVRSALMELDDISASEQSSVLTEFMRQQGSLAPTAESSDDVSLELDAAVEAQAGKIETASQRPSLTTASIEPPLAFLADVPTSALADVLRREHPQTAAVVIAQLPPQRAAQVLEELPASLATDALERMAWIGDIAPEIVGDLARELRQQLAPHLKARAADASSLAHLAAVLDAMGGHQKDRALQQLAQRNTSLGERLGVRRAAPPVACEEPERVVSYRYRLESPLRVIAPPPLSRSASADDAEESWLAFDDLELLEDAALRTVFAASEPTTALRALTGAEPRLLARILSQLPARQAAVLRQRLEHPGAIRLRDIDAARCQVAAVASRMAHEGTIALPQGVRFAAAV